MKYKQHGGANDMQISAKERGSPAELIRQKNFLTVVVNIKGPKEKMGGRRWALPVKSE